MKKWLLIALLSFRLVKVQAQAEPVESYSKADTIRAIGHLFDAKRSGGYVFMRTGIPLTLIGGLAGFLTTTLGAVVSLGQTKKLILPLTLVGSSIGVVPTGIGVIKKFRFSRRREQALLSAYDDGKPLPVRIQRRLKARFFW